MLYLDSFAGAGGEADRCECMDVAGEAFREPGPDSLKKLGVLSVALRCGVCRLSFEDRTASLRAPATAAAASGAGRPALSMPRDLGAEPAWSVCRRPSLPLADCLSCAEL